MPSFPPVAQQEEPSNLLWKSQVALWSKQMQWSKSFVFSSIQNKDIAVKEQTQPYIDENHIHPSSDNSNFFFPTKTWEKKKAGKICSHIEACSCFFPHEISDTF